MVPHQTAELAIPEFGVDRKGIPFDTTAVSLSFVKEKRNDPFNPSSGSFLTADMKLGLPLFEKDYIFLKFFWNYQQHYSFLHDCVFSFSIKNGFGFGDMSITERFFAGGSHSFRGTRNDRLGPIHLDTNEPEGGNVLFLVNMEVTVPSLLIPMEDLYLHFFRRCRQCVRQVQRPQFQQDGAGVGDRPETAAPDLAPSASISPTTCAVWPKKIS